jgi:hypothetical protein
MLVFKRLWRMFLGNCRKCGCEETRNEKTPEDERPHWHIYCTRCGERRNDLDGFADR